MVTATPMYGFEVKAREEMMSLESGAYDPGLPETGPAEGEDIYYQSLTGGESTLSKENVSVPSVKMCIRDR